MGIGVPSHLCIVAEYWFIGRVWESLRFYKPESKNHLDSGGSRSIHSKVVDNDDNWNL